MTIQTLEGAMTASLGDYIIKGVKGEIYPCKPDIFEATYKQMDQDQSNDAVKTIVSILENVADDKDAFEKNKALYTAVGSEIKNRYDTNDFGSILMFMFTGFMMYEDIKDKLNKAVDEFKGIKED